MKLEHEFDYHALLKEPIVIGPAAFGTRSFHEVIGGAVHGKRLNGKVLTGGGDWLLIGPDGWGRLDVRAQMLTEDGAGIYIAYFGMLELNEKVTSALAAGQGTEFSDQYFRTNPRFETGDPRYAWLQESMFVAEGRIIPGPGVEYRVFRLA